MKQKQAILYLLRSGPKTTTEIIQAPYYLGAEYRRCISQLRDLGYKIDYTHRKGGAGFYTLLSEPPKAGPDGQFEMGLNDRKNFLDKKGDMW